jgi:glycosyltransferase involved in cell wall biosynthesis
MAREMGIEDMVKFVGRISYFDVNKYLNIADIGITAKLSKTEANIKVLDYMAAGLPVVLFDTQINHDLMGELGTYCRYGDAEDMAIKIDFLIKNQQLIEELRPKLRRHVIHRFSWEKEARKIEIIYKRLIERRHKPMSSPVP